MIYDEGFALKLPLETYPQPPFCIYQIGIPKGSDPLAGVGAAPLNTCKNLSYLRIFQEQIFK